MGFPRR